MTNKTYEKAEECFFNLEKLYCEKLKSNRENKKFYKKKREEELNRLKKERQKQTFEYMLKKKHIRNIGHITSEYWEIKDNIMKIFIDNKYTIEDLAGAKDKIQLLLNDNANVFRLADLRSSIFAFLIGFLTLFATVFVESFSSSLLIAFFIVLCVEFVGLLCISFLNRIIKNTYPLKSLSNPEDVTYYQLVLTCLDDRIEKLMNEE